MRISHVVMYASPGEEIINFSLRDADPLNRYIVRNMIGLDAEELIPKFYGSGLQAQNKFFEFGLKPREIVVRVVLNPRFRIDESYSDVRDELYRAISSTRSGVVTLHFNSGATTVAKISGFITKFEVPYFTELPEVQITIRCDDPMFRAINPVVHDADELLIFSRAIGAGGSLLIPDSLSTAPHGFVLQLTFTATTPWLLIQDAETNPDWTFKVVPSGGFLANDVLHFSSDYVNKHLYMVRASVTTHLIDRIEPNSMWPILFPGVNAFHFPDMGKMVFNDLEYYAAYWGV